MSSRKVARTSPSGGQIQAPPRLAANPSPQLHVGAQQPPAEPSEPQWVPLGTYVPEPLKRRLKARCAAEGVEMKRAVTEAIEDWLARPASG